MEFTLSDGTDDGTYTCKYDGTSTLEYSDNNDEGKVLTYSSSDGKLTITLADGDSLEQVLASGSWTLTVKWNVSENVSSETYASGIVCAR